MTDSALLDVSRAIGISKVEQSSAGAKMDEFRNMAWNALTSQSFSAVPKTDHHTFCISRSSAILSSGKLSHATSSWLAVSSEDLVGFFSSEESGLRLIDICTDNVGALIIDAAIFSRLWRLDSVGFDNGALWLIIHKYDGYHHFRGSNGIDTFFFGFPLSAIVWTFNYKTLATRAIFVSRYINQAIQLPSRASDLGKTDVRLTGMYELAEVIKHHEAHLQSPVFISYVTALTICIRYDRFDGENDLAEIRRIEEFTGFKYFGTPARVDFDIEKLTRWLQISGQVLITTLGRKRALRSVTSMLDHMTSEMDAVELDHLQTDLQTSVSDSKRALTAAIPFIKSRMQAYDDYMDYMTVRVERLSNIVSLTATSIEVHYADLGIALHITDA